MLSRKTEIGVGLATVVLAVILLAFAIPYGIVTPRNVRAIVLSPLFWPTILASLLLLCGAALAARAYFDRVGPSEEEPLTRFDRKAVLRITGFVVLIALYYLAIPVLGMVWASAAAFAAMLLITGSPRWISGLACAFLLPLALYGFFYHVAGVPVPQGEFLRLP